MNLLKKTLVPKLMLTAMALICAMAASAASKLYIDPVVFDDYEVREIPVTFEHDGNMGALQFDIVLSKSLEFADKADAPAITRNAAFLADGQIMATRLYTEDDFVNNQRARVMVTSTRGNLFPEKKGVVAYVRIKAKDNALDKTIEKNPELFITITRAKATDPAGKVVDDIDDKAFDVSQISEISMNLTGGDFIMNPGSEKKVSINLTNTVKVSSLQFDVTLPEGFTIKPNSYQLGQRASNGAILDYFPGKENPATTRFIIYDMTTNEALGNTTSGDIVSFVIVAPETFGEKVEIKVTGIEISDKNSQSFFGSDFSVAVTNGGTTKTEADAKIAALEKALADAIAKIAETCPDVKDNFKGDEITAQITALKGAVDAAYKDNTLTDPKKYAEVMAPAAEIEKAIAKLVTDAEAAQVTFNVEAANTKALAEIKTLDDALAAALAKIAETCPDVKDNFKGEDVTAQIGKLKDAVAAAYADKSIADAKKYAEVMTPKAAIEEAIAKLIADAEAAQKAFDAEAARQAKNKEAYDKDVAELDAITAELDAAADAIKAKYPEWPYFITEKAKVSSMIKEARKEAKEAYEDVAEEGEYAYVLDKDTLREAIEAFKTIAEQSGIDSIANDVANGSVRIYTIDGIRHENLVKGALNIVVKSDGSAVKVYVK